MPTEKQTQFIQDLLDELGFSESFAISECFPGTPCHQRKVKFLDVEESSSLIEWLIAERDL